VSSSAATYVVENCVYLSFVLSYRYQFVAALEDAKKLFTVVSDTATGMIITIQVPGSNL
jgi:hypothetical protein